MDWAINGLCCPDCGGTLCTGPDMLVCETCRAPYPVLFGVPLLAKGVAVGRREVPAPGFVDAMARFLGREGAESKRQIRDCFGLDLRFGDAVLQTEADQFLNRLRSSGIALPAPFEEPKRVFAPFHTLRTMARALTERRKPSGQPIDGIELKLLVPPKTVLPGKIFSVSVVVANGTGRTISSDRGQRIVLSYWWVSGQERIEGLRTPLLIEMEADRQISMPILVEAPPRPGTYRLEVMALIDGLTWIQTSQTATDIEVDHTQPDPLAVDWRPDPHSRGVEQDHSRAVELCRDWMRDLIVAEQPQVVELGGNFNPMAVSLYGDRYNVDIDAFGLMTFNIRGEGANDVTIKNLVSNGMSLPFRPGSLDVIMMFATFHHFPDPIALLEHLKSKLKDDGIICLMCEPIGHVFRETGAVEFIGELNRGVYEQSFMPWEYRDMLAAAGLEVVRSSLDVGSLKLAARKAR